MLNNVKLKMNQRVPNKSANLLKKNQLNETELEIEFALNEWHFLGQPVDFLSFEKCYKLN